MKNTFTVIPLIFLLCFIVGCLQRGEVGDQPVVDVETLIQGTKEGYAKWEAAVNSANIDGRLSSFADDVILIPPNEPAHIGKEELRSYFQQMFDKFTAQQKYVVEDVKVSDNLVVAHVTYSVFYTPKAGGESFQTNGNIIDVCEKQPDGAWKTIYSIWSDEGLVRPPQAE